ncbi:hypothetical protein COL26b_005479 [Colletotrichum chrysophilum]|uniref:uncharacterized protein n=1 Tax=Colletotrichum chrysophilum TaxID=1836956 RepID=UPI0023005054|nr:uncharacterized protein COL26b_005479 [Colletotrichum chrysophilum]KAJ0376280.1 hypothetical protein COL26b_005479 [Colletotrichum chrysophilum]
MAKDVDESRVLQHGHAEASATTDAETAKADEHEMAIPVTDDAWLAVEKRLRRKLDLTLMPIIWIHAHAAAEQHAPYPSATITLYPILGVRMVLHISLNRRNS